MNEGYHFLFAFEEAIGFMIDDVCLDKDGIRGLAVFAELASELKDEGRTLAQYLDSLYAKYGYFVTNNRYFFCYEPSKQVEIFEKHLRCRDSPDDPAAYPKKFGRFAVKNVRDLTTGYDSCQPDCKAILPVSASSQMITFYFENGCVLTLRGSGTEPKLKYYAELSGTDGAAVTKELAELLSAVVEEGLHPQKYGLIAPSD
jgi:phosphomannomutase